MDSDALAIPWPPREPDTKIKRPVFETHSSSAFFTRQYMLASGALQIENPDKAGDGNATALAAVESVLKTYQAILRQKPDAKAKPLDDLLKEQSQGKLDDALKQCS